MKILKFGGKSLANGKTIQSVIEIISDKFKNNESKKYLINILLI